MAVRRLAVVLGVLLSFRVTVAGDEIIRPSDLATQMRAVTDAPQYQHGRWGILVVEADTGRMVYEKNPDTFCIPASTTKLYSCASALHHVGPDFKFQTPVYRRGTVKDKTLT